MADPRAPVSAETVAALADPDARENWSFFLLLRDTLIDTGWNVSEAARRLDISHAHIHRLLKAFGIEREQR